MEGAEWASEVQDRLISYSAACALHGVTHYFQRGFFILRTSSDPQSRPPGNERREGFVRTLGIVRRCHVRTLVAGVQIWAKSTKAASARIVEALNGRIMFIGVMFAFSAPEDGDLSTDILSNLLSISAPYLSDNRGYIPSYLVRQPNPPSLSACLCTTSTGRHFEVFSVTAARQPIQTSHATRFRALDGNREPELEAVTIARVSIPDRLLTGRQNHARR